MNGKAYSAALKVERDTMRALFLRQRDSRRRERDRRRRQRNVDRRIRYYKACAARSAARGMNIRATRYEGRVYGLMLLHAWYYELE